MNQQEKIFIIFESQYGDLHRLTKDKNYTVKIMGEITWFLSLMKTLEMRGYKIIHCRNEFTFITEYTKHIHTSDLYFLMEYLTIPKLINILQSSIDKIYCMDYWGANIQKAKKLGVTPNNKHVKLKNILTPFNYNEYNTYLGFNMDVLCRKVLFRKYKNYGILWGKDAELIDLELVRFLCSRGVKFYATSPTPIAVDGVVNLGILPKKKWYQLLSDCEFVLGSGHPKSGPTIIESLYYKTVLIGPKSQFPHDTHNENIHFTDCLEHQDIYKVIQNLKFKSNPTVDELCNSDNFNERINSIFDIEN